jgi:hypothetical protein
VKIGLSGGDGLRAKLEEIRQKVGTGELLRLGFLENATYPDGTPVAYIAAVNEYGGSFEVEERQQTIYRQVDKNGDFAKGGRFVKAAKSNFASEHTVAAHTVTIPPRPFFRSMIAAKSPGWGASMAKVLKAADCNLDVAFGRMGEGIRGQLQSSIRDFSSPANAPSTIAKKGFNDPLIDSGHMLNSVDYDIQKAAAE